MYDGSTLPLEENIRETKKIIELARAKGVSVEAEVGEMTTEEKDSQKLEQNAIPATYTDVNKAKKFVEQTDIDALAVSFGTVHGILPTKPALDLHLLNELNKQISVPLVMHGGSGLDSSDYEQVIDGGIRKINYFSYGYQSVAKKVTSYIQKNNVLYDEISYFTIKTFTEVFSKIMAQIKSAGKV
jgi:fructose-bisphosphate aldolase class II